MMAFMESAVTEIQKVRSDCDAFDPFHDKVCCRGCLWLAYVRSTWGEFRKEMRTLPKQELSIEIRYVDSVHVNDIDVFETRKSKVFENLTAKATGSYNENPVCFKICLCLCKSQRYERGAGETSSASKNGGVKGPACCMKRSMAVHLDVQSTTRPFPFCNGSPSAWSAECRGRGE